MTAATVELDLDPDLVAPRGPQPRRTSVRPARPGRSSARSVGPRLRPTGTVQPPLLSRPGRVAPRSCAVSSPPAPLRSSTWALTERGIAVVLVLVAMITVAAVSVIALTAAHVTSDRFQSTTSVLSQS